MSGERVLLVDDETDFVEALSARLEARELVVDTASSGESALEKVKTHTFDAVVLDLAMPGMDGMETLQGMREVNPDLQVILLTGHGNLESGIRAMKLGALDFLEKPVKLDKLLGKIEEAWSKSSKLEEVRLKGIVNDILSTKGW